uniref:Uncharacterized protein n=1 Tax=Anguilla anguilla TaxID=7936 RepID=A0A0E9S2I2_ANGAN
MQDTVHLHKEHSSALC